MNSLHDASAQADSSGAPMSRAHALKCIEIMAAATSDFAHEHFPNFWGEWVVSIEKREENARSNKEQIALAELIKQLRYQGGDSLDQFVRLLQQCCSDFSEQQLSTPSGQERFAQPSGLSLVDNAELEETIAITSICHRADSQFAEILWALHQRLAILNDGKKLDERENPVSPIQFCEALRKVIVPLKLETRIKVLGYKHFEASMVKVLGALYEELNARLAEEGVLPNLRFTGFNAGADSGASAAEEQEQEHELQPSESEPPQASTPDSAAETPRRRASDRDPEPRRRATDQLFNEQTEKTPEQYQQGLISAIRLLQTHLGGAVAAAPAALNTGANPGQGGGVPAAAPQAAQQEGFSPPGGGGGGTAGAGQSAAHAISSLMGAVQQVQTQQAVSAQTLLDAEPGQVQPLAVGAVSSQLLEELKKQGDDEVRSDDMHTIELVGLLFEYILSDEQLPDSVKALLSYLHTPILKLAFIDRDFFENVDHPARVLLNQMAEAGARWIGNDGTNQYNIYEKIKTTVFEILKNFGNDAKVFAEALLDFSAYTRNISRRQELMEKRVLEKARGEEKLREAKILVNTKVSKLIDGKDLPSPILLLLLLPWSDYLSFVILRYGADSDSFSQALKVAEDLLWTIEPKSLEADKVKQLEMQEKLMQTLQSGFETIGYEQNKSRKLIDAVESLQKLALKSRSVEPAPEPMRAKLENMAAEKAGNVEKDNTVASAEEATLIEKLKLIEFGTWLEDDQGKRVKVAWYNHKTMHYMLVDQQGRKVSMSSALQMARAMIAGKLRVIAGSAKPFFERALENIYHNLNARASGELLNRE